MTLNVLYVYKQKYNTCIDLFKKQNKRIIYSAFSQDRKQFCLDSIID